MKKGVIAAVTALVGSMMLQGCGTGVADRRVDLQNEDDSLSFAVSMLIAKDMPMKMTELGIEGADVEHFVRGLCDAFPVDGSSAAKAYAEGVLVAASAMELLDLADKAIYPGDTVNKVNRLLFLEGLKASAYGSGKTMTTDVAVDYYNSRIFRVASEEFIRDNRERPGVLTLPSGVQYKVERMGKGAKATLRDTVKCIYKGTYPNGSTFDSSRGYAVDLKVASLVPGLAEALMLLPEGTQCKIYVPWELGYGAEGSDGIPPYSALVFDVEIIGIVATR